MAYAAEMYRLKQSDRALELLSADETIQNVTNGFARWHLLLEDDSQHEAIRSECLAILKDGRAYYPCLKALEMLLLLGKLDEATNLSTGLENLPSAYAPEYGCGAVHEYLADQTRVAEDRFLMMAEEFGLPLTRPHYFIALKSLVQGDKAKAAKHFEECARVGMIALPVVYWAHAYHDRLLNEPEWPDWIQDSGTGKT